MIFWLIVIILFSMLIGYKIRDRKAIKYKAFFTQYYKRYNELYEKYKNTKILLEIKNAKIKDLENND